MMSKGFLVNGLLAVSSILWILAVATLVPYHTKMMSDLGYFSMCPFAPWSTLTLAILGGVSGAVRGHIQRQTKTPALR